MIKINLLPAEIEKKASKRKKGVLIVAGVLIFVSIILGLYMMRVAELRGLNSEIASADRQLRQLAPVVEKVNSLKERKAALNRKLEVISDLMDERLAAPVFMEEFAALIPQDVWIEALGTRTRARGKDLNIDVVARDNYGVAELLNALEISPRFSNIQFTGLTSIEYGEGEVRSFNLRCRYHLKETGEDRDGS